MNKKGNITETKQGIHKKCLILAGNNPDPRSQSRDRVSTRQGTNKSYKQNLYIFWYAKNNYTFNNLTLSSTLWAER